jgi:phage gpG-like protein
MSMILTPASQEVLNRLKNAGPVFEQAATAFLQKAGLMVLSVAKPEAPRDKGTLSNSLTASEVKKTMHQLSIAVGTNVAYAPHHEFGTGIYGKTGAPIRPKRAKVLAWRDKGGKMIFARQVLGVKKREYLKKGVDAVNQNPAPALNEADKIIQGKL